MRCDGGYQEGGDTKWPIMQGPCPPNTLKRDVIYSTLWHINVQNVYVRKGADPASLSSIQLLVGLSLWLYALIYSGCWLRWALE